MSYNNRGFNVFIMCKDTVEKHIEKLNVKHAIVNGDLYVAVDGERCIRFIDATPGFNDTCIVWIHVPIETLIQWGFVDPHNAAELIKGERYLTDLSVKELLD